MKRYLMRHLSMTAIAAMSVALFSCKDDEDPVIPVVSFQQATRTVDESAGTIDVLVQLDVASPNDIQVGYSLSGTATEGTSSSNDYQAMGTYGSISIAKGSTSGTLQLQIKQDDVVEADETIIITLSASGTATLGSVSSTTITLHSDDLGPKVSFTTTTTTINESDGTLDIELTLDKAAGQDITVDYAFNYDDIQTVATALDSVWAYNEDVPSQYYDFYVVGGTYGKLTIPAGSSTAKLSLRFYSDFLWDENERIEITLTGAGTGGQLGANTKHTVTVKQEDGRLIGLLWDPSYNDVDLDLILWIGDGTDFDALTGSFSAATTPRSEEVFIPTVFADLISEEVGDAVFGVSAVYYEGTANPMNFEVHHVDFVDGGFEAAADRDIIPGAYTLANINAWETFDDVQIEHTFDLTGGAYANLSDITVPASGSRQATYKLPGSISKSNVRAKFASRAHVWGLRK
ncbi:MAG TPA: Calx-beta domain-containing protein [Chryseolinea sp.]|nr:Calx-beta domain-containing protein [Chryseolinea sp.]